MRVKEQDNCCLFQLSGRILTHLFVSLGWLFLISDDCFFLHVVLQKTDSPNKNTFRRVSLIAFFFFFPLFFSCKPVVLLQKVGKVRAVFSQRLDKNKPFWIEVK